MYRVIIDCSHSYAASEHVERVYRTQPAAVAYMCSLFSILDSMQNGGSIEAYRIQLVAESKED